MGLRFLVLVALFSVPSFTQNTAPLVQVDFYVMSKCPYAAGYVTDFMQSVFQAEGVADIINLTMNYIAAVDSLEPSGFYSLHGQSEVWGDITELCIQHLVGLSNYVWFDYVNCVDQNFTEIPDNTQACASQNGINYKNIEGCVQSTVGINYMYQTINVTDSLGWNPQPGSPTVYINHNCVYGFSPCQNLDPSTNAVLRYICKKYTGQKPKGCSSVLE